MLSNIKYVYDTDTEGKKTLLGARIESLVEGSWQKKEIYVGINLVLEDILENKVNARILGVKDLDAFAKQYQVLGAVGIVFFPQTDHYAFLEEGDEVVAWERPETISEVLERAVSPYRFEDNRNIKSYTQNMLDNLDPDDPMVEFCGLSLSRHCSDR